MKAFSVPASAFMPGRNNPAGRWDAPYHRLIQVLQGPTVITAALLQDFVHLGSTKVIGRHIVANIESVVCTATALAPVVAAIMHELRLTDPDPALRAGIERLARLLLAAEAGRLKQEIAAMQQRLTTLEGS